MLDASDIREFSARGSALAQDIHHAEVSIAGAAPVAAIVTEPRRESMLVAGASMEEGELIVRIRKANLATKPAEHVSLRWRRPGETAYRPPQWRISVVTEPSIDDVWHLRCVPF
jgi:hypothetical protein